MATVKTMAASRRMEERELSSMSVYLVSDERKEPTTLRSDGREAIGREITAGSGSPMPLPAGTQMRRREVTR